MLKLVGNATPDTTKVGSRLSDEVGNCSPYYTVLAGKRAIKVGNGPKLVENTRVESKNISQKWGIALQVYPK